MRTLIVGSLLAVTTIALVVFMFVELHESKPPPPAVAAPSMPTVAPPPPPIAARPPPRPAAPAAIDPLDVVIDGKTRRDWRKYYAARQQQLGAELYRHQSIIKRAEAGEEPDPEQLGEAHTRVLQIKEELRKDVEEMHRIEGTPNEPSAP